MIKQLLLIGFSAGLLLSACSNEHQAETTTNTSQESDTVQQSETNTTTSQESDTVQQSETTTHQQTTVDPIDESELSNLAVSVSDIIKKINEITPSGTSEEQMSQFLALDQEIETLEDQLDVFEDQVEANYQANQITAEQYTSLESDIEALEDQLDQAENTLETIFQIDND